MIKIPVKRSLGEIRSLILEYTPPGSSSDEVRDFIDHRLFRRIHHENKQYKRKPVRYIKEDWELDRIKTYDWWPKEIELGGIIKTPIDYYGFFPKKVVGATWCFDKNDRLVAVKPYKSTAAT